jgi:hypothetical protein
MKRIFSITLLSAFALVTTGLVGGGVASAAAVTCSGGATGAHFPVLGDFGHIPDAAAACPAPGDPAVTVTDTELGAGGIIFLASATRTFSSTGASAESRVLMVIVPGVVGVQVARGFASSTCADNGTASQTLESSVVRVFNPTTGATIFSGQASANTTLIPGVLVLNRQSSTVAGNTAEGSVDAVVVLPGGANEIRLGHAESDVECALPITSVSVFGHAHEDVDDPATNETEAIHIEVIVSDTNITDATPPVGKKFGAVIYEDSRQPPAGLGPETLKCRANNGDISSLSAPAPNVAVIEIANFRCFGISGLEEATLTITDNGPNPPNSDGFSIEIRDKATKAVEYSRSSSTTVGGGDLTVTTA